MNDEAMKNLDPVTRQQLRDIDQDVEIKRLTKEITDLKTTGFIAKLPELIQLVLKHTTVIEGHTKLINELFARFLEVDKELQLLKQKPKGLFNFFKK